MHLNSSKISCSLGISRYNIEKGTALAHIRKEFEVLQKKAIRIINNVNFSDHRTSYFVNKKVLPFQYIFELNVATYIYKTTSIHLCKDGLLYALHSLEDPIPSTHYRNKNVWEWNILLSSLFPWYNNLSIYYLDYNVFH